MTESSDPGEPREHPGDPVRDSRFLRYLGGTGLADIGDQAWIVVLAFAAASTGDPLTATLTVAAGTVPRAILDLIGGAIADRLPTRPLVAVAATARVLALVIGLLALIRMPQHTIWIMVGLAILFGAADAIHKPAIGTLPRQLVPVSRLVKAVGYRQLLARSALLIGPALAGVVLGAWALKGALGGLIAVFAIAAILLGGVRARYQRELSPRQSVVSSTREVVGYLRTDSRARALTFTMIGLNFFVIPVITAGIALRVHENDWGVHALGWLTAAIGVGAVIGNLISLRLKPIYPMRFALIMLVLQGIGLALAGLLPMVGAGIALALVGFTAGISSPMLGGTTQAIVREAYLGRVYALFGLADDALIPFALIGYGALAGVIGVGPTTVICGLAMAVLMSVGLFRRPLRSLRIDEADSAAAGQATSTPDEVGTEDEQVIPQSPATADEAVTADDLATDADVPRHAADPSSEVDREEPEVRSMMPLRAVRMDAEPGKDSANTASPQAERARNATG